MVILTKKRLQEIADSLNVEVWELFTESPRRKRNFRLYQGKGTIYEIKSRQDIENLLKNLG